MLILKVKSMEPKVRDFDVISPQSLDFSTLILETITMLRVQTVPHFAFCLRTGCHRGN